MISLMFLLSFGLAEENLKFDDKWQMCRKNSDCVAIEAVCNWECVNKNHKEKAKKYYEKMSAVAECMGQTHTAPPTYCAKKKCECKKAE